MIHLSQYSSCLTYNLGRHKSAVKVVVKIREIERTLARPMYDPECVGVYCFVMFGDGSIEIGALRLCHNKESRILISQARL